MVPTAAVRGSRYVQLVHSVEDSYLVVDIETVPDTALWRKPETPLGKEPPFPPTYAHRVIVIGCMWLSPTYGVRKLGVVGSGTEEHEILGDFSRFVERHRPHLVTFNGRTFDMPVLAVRSLRCGVPMGWYYERGLRYRYSESGHIDLCDWIADHGAARSSSLDALARLIGLPGKVGVDGSQIEGLHASGHVETIKNYCLADVAQTALLFLRFRLLQGSISRAVYVDAASALLAELRADRRLDSLTAEIDASRLLLQPESEQRATM